MDHFERELARMMRDAQEYTPFEPAQQNRLRTGVLVRRRVRAAQKAVGSVLVAAGLGVGLVLLPHAPDRDQPQAPVPRPSTGSSSPTSTLSPTQPPSSSSTGSAPTTPTAPITTESAVGSSSSVGTGPPGTATAAPPATIPATPSGSIMSSSPPTTTGEPSSSVSATGVG
ncbi:cellulase [Streptomyces sp. NPDC097610]|uniref:cellulase n=1 Tax=Streptomyces sp. NPDC097610 TaxID=3157227 RepID=UPI0033189620